MSIHRMDADITVQAPANSPTEYTLRLRQLQRERHTCGGGAERHGWQIEIRVYTSERPHANPLQKAHYSI